MALCARITLLSLRMLNVPFARAKCRFVGAKCRLAVQCVVQRPLVVIREHTHISGDIETNGFPYI